MRLQQQPKTCASAGHAIAGSSSACATRRYSIAGARRECHSSVHGPGTRPLEASRRTSESAIDLAVESVALGAAVGNHERTVGRGHQSYSTFGAIFGAVLRLHTIVTARIAITTPSDSSTGILMTSISSILVPMNTSTTASP